MPDEPHLDRSTLNPLPSGGSRTILTFALLLFCLLVYDAASPHELYTANQHTYFLHGAADAGTGFLDRDWLANTTDPFPLFSAFVEAVLRWGHPAVFHVVSFLLFSLYLLALLGVLVHLWPELRGSWPLTLVLLITALLHAEIPNEWFASLAGVRLDRAFVFGMAHQYLIVPYLQPSDAGVLLLVSLLLFLRQRPVFAAVLAALVPWVHSTYLLPAGLLVAGYLAAMIADRAPLKRVLATGAAPLGIVLPLLILLQRRFLDLPPDMLRAGAETLVQQRIPYHALPAHWFAFDDVIRLLLIAALVVLSPSRRLRIAVAVAVLGAALVSLLQLVTGSAQLALLFPWRLSVLLVPLGTMAVAGRLAVFASPRLPGGGPWTLLRSTGLGLVLIVLAVSGLRETSQRAAQRVHAPAGDVTAQVRATSTADRVYLIPPELDAFRMEAKVPVVVDHKSHPYRADEVMDWQRRLATARQAFGEDDAVKRRALETAVEAYGATHAVAPRGWAPGASGWRRLYVDDDYALWRAPVNGDRELRDPADADLDGDRQDAGGRR